MGFIKEENIGKISFIGSIIIVVLLTTIIGGIFIHDKYANFQKNLERVESNFIALQKERLKSEVTRDISFIDATRKLSAISLKDAIKSRVYAIHSTIDELYKNNKKSVDSEGLVSLIKACLRSVRFNNGRGYFFILSADGVHILYPPDSGIEGTNINLSSNQERVDIFRKMTAKIKSAGEGFIQYKWLQPDAGSSQLLDKVVFVKYCKLFKWIIGSGEYLDNAEEKTQQSIAKPLNSVVIDKDSLEYIFIYRLHNINGGDGFATMVVNPNRPDLIGKKISDKDVDAKGNMFRKDILKGIREKGEVFVTYFYKKPGSQELVPKLSYFKYYPEWNWIVARGIYIDSLDKRVAQMQEDLREEITDTIRYLLLFLIVICIVFLGISYYFSQKINDLFEGYKRVQKEQQNELESVNKILQIQATTDTLTQLYNRVYFNQGLAKEMLRSERYGSPLSLVIFDIDDFKQINDKLGHLAGDEILKELSLLCKTTIRHSDILARWGGEEFIILVPENKKKQTIVFSEKIRKSIDEYSFSIDSSVTCSFGVTQFLKGEERDSFIKRADKALYDAKQSGKNRVNSL